MTAARSITHDHLLAATLTESAEMERPVVLDVGCGAGGLLRRLAEGFAEVSRDVDLRGFDITDGDSSHYDDFPGATVRMLDSEAPGAPWGDRISAVAEADPWPMPGASVDVAVSNQVMEHVIDLDRFFEELARVLRPGGVSINLFPVRSVVIEGHIGVPFAHWWASESRRAAWIRLMNRMGFGSPDGSADYAERQARYLVEGCAYRSLGQIRRTATRHGLALSTRHTGKFVMQKVRQLRGEPLAETYAPQSSVRSRVDRAVVQWVTSVTVILERA